MLDYKSIVRLKRLGLNNSAIASIVVKTTGLAGGLHSPYKSQLRQCLKAHESSFFCDYCPTTHKWVLLSC